MELIYSFSIANVLTSANLMHAHSYIDITAGGWTVTGNWIWCNRCKCLVTTKCDHRKRLCKHAAQIEASKAVKA